MKFKKSLSLLLAVSQASFGAAFALADGPAPTTTTPEMTLISSVIALQGQPISNDTYTQKIATDLAIYNATAPVEGRTERAQRAMVSLGVFTVDQAQDFMQAVQTESNAITQAGQTQGQASTIQALMHLSAAQGAQFSGDFCDISVPMAVAGSGALVVGLFSLIVVRNEIVDGLIIGGASIGALGGILNAAQGC